MSECPSHSLYGCATVCRSPSTAFTRLVARATVCPDRSMDDAWWSVAACRRSLRDESLGRWAVAVPLRIRDGLSQSFDGLLTMIRSRDEPSLSLYSYVTIRRSARQSFTFARLMHDDLSHPVNGL
ncbi:hypothetical protein FRX31_020355 [Thalictrum thalictroides]|uniref:Uncharacterized protein n=1 Tax=Thalictrum thalictroides TaxID=46969 RepID=A0A7J6VZC4_THATH|nr:hypothetical protein FRX31_020355 [Thalictrum thalictroides]